MKFAIASGKGGTGKTTVAANLAYIASRDGENVAYLDCDVEEPNGHLFLKPEFSRRETVGHLVPRVSEENCNLCGRCAEICQYGAIVNLGRKILVYPDLCHACGGCALVCPVDAIEEISRAVGHIEVGYAGQIQFIHGLLNIGEAMSPPVIKAVKAAAAVVDLVFVDAPPGTSCPVIETVRDADYVVLVTEPTPFGLNDLKLAVEMTRVLELHFGVVINRAGCGDDGVARYCREEEIKILAEIPDDRRIAEVYSRGEMICESLPDLRAQFADLLRVLVEEVRAGSAS